MSKKITKLLALCCALVICFSFMGQIPVRASESVQTEDNEVAYCTVVIHEYPSESTQATRATKSKTASKTVYYKNASGTVLWQVEIVATFSYTGSSSKCTSAYATATSSSSYWKASITSCTRSGNHADATAVGKQYSSSNKLLKTVTKSVTISCSNAGAIS